MMTIIETQAANAIIQIAKSLESINKTLKEMNSKMQVKENEEEPEGSISLYIEENDFNECGYSFGGKSEEEKRAIIDQANDWLRNDAVDRLKDIVEEVARENNLMNF